PRPLHDALPISVHDLAYARLPLGLVGAEARLAEILRDDDVRRELGPPRGDLRAIHLEHDGAVGVRDHALTALPHHLVEGMRPLRREVTLEAQPLRLAAPARGASAPLTAAALFARSLHVVHSAAC